MQYPQLVENLIHEWLGMSTDDGVHGTNSDSVVNFEADVPKQEAVVNAFKVSINSGLQARLGLTVY